MGIFLRAKHWQLFVVTFGLPMIFYIILMAAIFSTMLHAENPDPIVIFQYVKFFPLIIILFAGPLYAWQYAVATRLQLFIPAAIKMKVTRFKIFFFIPIVYIILIMGFAVTMMGGFFSDIAVANSNNFIDEHIRQFVFSFALIVPLHLFSMFCIIYCLYFIAKTIKTVELQRETTFSDFVLEFFLVWFYPIGIWILQPKINQMVEQPSSSENL